MGATLPPEVVGSSEARFDPNDELQFPALLSNGVSVNSIKVHASEEPTSSSNTIKLKDNLHERVIELHEDTKMESCPSMEQILGANPPDETPVVKDTSSVSEEPLPMSGSDNTDENELVDLQLEFESEKLNIGATLSPAQDAIPQDEEVRIEKEEVANLPSSESFEVLSEEEKTRTPSLTESLDELSNLSNGRSSSPVISNISDNGIPAVPDLDLNTSGWTKVNGDGLLGIYPRVKESTTAANPPPVRTLHTFYMVRIPKPLESKGRSEVKMAEIVLKEKTEKRDYLNAALQMKKANKHEVIERLKAAREKERIIREALREKRKETDPLHAALNKVKEASRYARERGQDLCTSEKELNDRIAALESRIQHDTISLQEEKQILREIRQLNASRDQVCANAVVHAEVQETLGQRDEIQAQLKPLLAEVDLLRKEQQTLSSKVAAVEEECNVLDEAILQLVKQREAANSARQEAFLALQNLYKAENSRNDGFYENRREIQLAKQHASQSNKAGVEEICNAQMERVLALWIGDADFRAEYVKNNERSTLKRLETLDGRALGPDEEPPLLVSPNEFPVPTPESRTGSSSSEKAQLANASLEKAKAQQAARELKASSTPVKSSNGKSAKPEVAVLAPVAVSDVDTSHTSALSSVNSKPNDAEDTVKKEQEAMELKERMRQQQVAKAKEAEERKRKQAERNQAKALAWAKKEAERKEKEKERKARKKSSTAAAAVASGENVIIEEEIATVAHLGKVEASVVEDSPPSEQAVSRRRKKAVTQRPKASKVSIVNLSSKKSRWSSQFLMLMGAVLILIMIAVLLLYLYLWR